MLRFAHFEKESSLKAGIFVLNSNDLWPSKMLSIPKTSALGSLLAFVVRANINLYPITTGVTKFVIILCLIHFINLKFLYVFWLLTKFRIQFDIVSQDSDFQVSTAL